MFENLKLFHLIIDISGSSSSIKISVEEWELSLGLERKAGRDAWACRYEYPVYEDEIMTMLVSSGTPPDAQYFLWFFGCKYKSERMLFR